MSARIAVGALAVLVLTASGVGQLFRARPQSPPSPSAGQPIVLEGEALVGSAKATEGPVTAQPMAGFGAAWSGGSQLYWVPTQVGARLTLTVNVPTAGSYSLAGSITRASDYGNFQVLVNDAKVGSPFLGYANRVAHSGQVVLGRADFKAGPNLLLRFAKGMHHGDTEHTEENH